MTKLLEQALEAVRNLLPNAQDRITLSPEERAAIANSQDAAARGEFATDQQVRAVWRKHRL
jgi:hypothetical protein